MKKLLKKLENMMVAITFAEAGEYDKANQEIGVDLKHEQEDEAAQSLLRAKCKSAYESPGKQR